MKVSLSKYLLLVSILLCQCIDPIAFNNPGEDPPVVVDGLITNLAGPHKVKVLRSVPFTEESFDKLNFVPINDAVVFIEDDLGNREPLNLDADDPGSYLTSPSFQGVVGRQYRVSIRLSDGDELESEYETMLPSTGFNKVITTKGERTILKGGIQVPEYGEDISIEIHDNVSENNYYRWRWHSVYEIRKDLDPNPCWVIEHDNDNIAILRDGDRNGETFVQSVDFIPYVEKNDISGQFLLTVEQHTITARAFQYWDQIKKQREAQGTIFDPIPSPIQGNLFNKTNKDKRVVGFFGASSVVLERMYVRNLERNYAVESDCGNAPDIPPTCYDCSLRKNATRNKPEWY
ncbi:DUF4249 domain-containing protein [Fulvivirgaceae bacterium BMA10]|uniref:DUF4249 domain-containing protein n=1 Tax=Splendidivirga corallicola TaxID=3051826 RepID=A0ABT8KUW5_9BACT|nr:DUF4249 domain-containing protein [Fulvivirgaceae bacterium BMA10]